MYIQKKEDWVDVAFVPAGIVIWLQVLWLWTVATCTNDIIEADCAAMLIPIAKLLWTAHKWLKWVLKLNNNSTLTSYINTFWIKSTDILKNIKEKWLIWVNYIKYSKFLNNNPWYSDFKSSKAAFIGWNKAKNYVQKNTSIKTWWDIVTEINDIWLTSRIKFITDNSLVIKEVFKWNTIDIKMSDLIYEQIKFAWKDSHKLNNILLDNVVNEEIRDLILRKWNRYVIDNWWKIWWLDKMINNLLEKSWKSIKEINIFKDVDSLEDIYDIQLILR